VLASLALVVRRHGIRPTFDPRVVAVVTCVLTIAIVLILFASQPNQEVRYLLGLIPFLAVAIAVVIDSSGFRPIVVATAIVVAFEFVLVQLQSFGETPIASLSYYRLIAPTGETRFAKELNSVVDRTCTPESAGKINMVGADYPWFNHNTIEMIAFERHAESGLRCYYTALGYAEQSPEVAWKRVQEFDSPYYISVDYGNRSNPLPNAEQLLIAPSDPFNVVNTTVFNRVKSSGTYKVVPGSRESGVVVLQRASDVGK
jgi:hypothetical protein